MQLTARTINISRICTGATTLKFAANINSPELSQFFCRTQPSSTVRSREVSPGTGQPQFSPPHIYPKPPRLKPAPDMAVEGSHVQSSPPLPGAKDIGVPSLKLAAAPASQTPKFMINSLPSDVIQHVASYLSHDSLASLRLTSSKIYRALIAQPENIKRGNDAFLRIRYCEKTTKLAQTLVWQQRSRLSPSCPRPPERILLAKNGERVQYLLELYAQPSGSSQSTTKTQAEAPATRKKLSITEQARFSRAIYQLWIFSLLVPPLNGWPNTGWTGDFMELPALLALASWFQRCFDDWPAGNPGMYLTPEERRVNGVAPPGIEKVVRECAETCFIRAAMGPGMLAGRIGRSSSARHRSNRFEAVEGISRSQSCKLGTEQERSRKGMNKGNLQEMLNRASSEGLSDRFTERWRGFVVEVLGEKWVRDR